MEPVGLAMFPHTPIRTQTPGPQPTDPWEGGVYKIMEERGGVGQRTLQMKNALARTIKKEPLGIKKG